MLLWCVESLVQSEHCILKISNYCEPTHHRYFRTITWTGGAARLESVQPVKLGMHGETGDTSPSSIAAGSALILQYSFSCIHVPERGGLRGCSHYGIYFVVASD
jgi:hypothetical protein